MALRPQATKSLVQQPMVVFHRKSNRKTKFMLGSNWVILVKPLIDKKFAHKRHYLVSLVVLRGIGGLYVFIIPHWLCHLEQFTSSLSSVGVSKQLLSSSPLYLHTAHWIPATCPVYQSEGINCKLFCEAHAVYWLKCLHLTQHQSSNTRVVCP